MKADLDLKKLWSKQEAPLINTTVIFSLIRKYKKSKFKKVVFLNCVLLITIFVLVLIWIKFKPQFIITKIGIILVVCAMIFLIVSTSKLVSLYRKSNMMLSNSDYLKHLIKIKSQEIYIQNKVMNIYFILLTVGVSLYMYEYVLTLSWYLKIIIYGLFFLWIGFNWFFLRPRIIEKSNKKIEDLIYQLKTLEKQWGSSDIY